MVGKRVPEAEIIEIQGSGHAVEILECHPEALEMIAGWLEAQLIFVPD